MSLFQRLRDRRAGLPRPQPVLPPQARWSERKEDGERQAGSSRAGAADTEQLQQQQSYPPRYRLSSLVPDGVSSYVFLGFSTSGSFVWSYRQGDSSRPGEDGEWFYFQVWLWRQERPLVLLLSEPFYHWQDGGDDELSDTEHPAVQLLDGEDDSCVAVWGCKRPRRGDEWVKYHFAILPLPVLPLSASTTTSGAVPAAAARVAVASHRFTCDCQYDEFPTIPVSLHTVAVEPSATFAGRHMLLVQTCTAVNCLRFDVNTSSTATATPTASVDTSSCSVDVDDTSSADSCSDVRSLLHLRSDQRILGSHSWTSEQQHAAANDSKRQWRVVVRGESSLDIERLIAAVDELGSDFRLRDYHLRNLRLVSSSTSTTSIARTPSTRLTRHSLSTTAVQ